MWTVTIGYVRSGWRRSKTVTVDSIADVNALEQHAKNTGKFEIIRKTQIVKTGTPQQIVDMIEKEVN